jgi:branched-chain amino acid transport system substrate-binding protein
LYKAIGLTKDVQVWVHTATDLSTLRPLGAEAPEGLLGTNPYHYYFPDTAENKAFVESFKKAYNREPTAFALYGYLTGKFIAEAAKKAGSNDKEKIIDSLEGLTLNSPVGPVSIRKADHQIMMPMYFGKKPGPKICPILLRGRLRLWRRTRLSLRKKRSKRNARQVNNFSGAAVLRV